MRRLHRTWCGASTTGHGRAADLDLSTVIQAKDSATTFSVVGAIDTIPGSHPRFAARLPFGEPLPIHVGEERSGGTYAQADAKGKVKGGAWSEVEGADIRVIATE